MKITLYKASDFDAINKEWEAINAPVFLKRTKDPNVFMTKLKKGAESIVAELFLLNQMGISNDEKKNLEKKIWKSYFNSEIRRIEKEVEKYETVR